MKNQKENKKNKDFQSSHSIIIKIIAGVCAFLMFGSLFISILH